MGIINVMWPYIMEYGPLGGWWLVRRNNIIIRHRPIGILMRKYKYTCVSLYWGHAEYWFVSYKHGLWSDSFLKDYLMVLPYLKGFLYILVLLFCGCFFGNYFKLRVYFLSSYTTRDAL